MRGFIVYACVWACLLVQGCGSGPGGDPAPPAMPPVARSSEMLWDRDGVPHIYAERADSVAYAFGRAQMQMHAELLIRLYAQARGRGAEHYGAVFQAGEPFPTHMLEVDKPVRTMDFPRRAQA